MSLLQHKGWPKHISWKNEAALTEAGTVTVRFSEDLRKTTTSANHTRFTEVIRQGTSFLLNSVINGSSRRLEDVMDLDKAGDAFLYIATNIETNSHGPSTGKGEGAPLLGAGGDIIE